ncbi:MAG: glycosyltransferase family 2 protein [bacterium]|nr:glycosyltransferase family 2 protein [bacterium]
MKEEISVIIVTWNSGEYIEGCLKALGLEPASPSQGGYEIILVDNHSLDITVDLVRKNFLGVRIIENFSNVGLSRAINQGAKISNGRYLLILNPDVVVMEDTVKKLYQFMQEREEIGACGPRFLWPTGRIQPSCREFPNFSNLFLEFIGIGRIMRFSKWKMGYFNHNSAREVDQPAGSCLLVRKEIFNKVGGMNESYPFFMNDVDLCYKIKRMGYKLHFVPEANVIHYLGGSTRKVRRKMILEEHLSIYRYLRDHFNNYFLIALYGFLLLISSFYRILFSLIWHHR